MEKLYYKKPYVKEFEGTVLECHKSKDNWLIVLDRTAFYPEGGGQPSDTGTLDMLTVTDVHEKDGKILHTVNEPIDVGTGVIGRIHWERRFSNMQHHTGEHIISGLINKKYGYDNIGFHMGSEVMTIDLNGILTEDQLAEIEMEANEIVYKNLPIVELYLTKEELHNIEFRSKKELDGEVRIIQVPDSDTCACCGTHVAHTGEIGLIKLLNMINYKGGVRISILCGKPALMDYQKKHRHALEISNLLSAKPELIVDSVDKLIQDNKEKDQQLYESYHALFIYKTEGIPMGQKKLCLFEEHLSPILLRQFCNMLIEKKKAELILICSGDEDNGYKYVIASPIIDTRTYSMALNRILSGKGGGSERMAQGTFFTTKNQIIDCFYQ